MFFKISNWLEDDGFGSEADVLDTKLDDLKNLIRPVWERTYEHLHRPTKLEELNKALSSSYIFFGKIKNFTLEDTPITQIEIDTLEKLINEIAVSLSK